MNNEKISEAEVIKEETQKSPEKASVLLGVHMLIKKNMINS